MHTGADPKEAKEVREALTEAVALRNIEDVEPTEVIEAVIGATIVDREEEEDRPGEHHTGEEADTAGNMRSRSTCRMLRRVMDQSHSLSKKRLSSMRE